MIVAGLQADPAPVDPVPVDQDMHRVPGMVLAVRAGRCIPRGPALVALPALVDGPLLAPHGLVLVRVPASVRRAPVQGAQVV